MNTKKNIAHEGSNPKRRPYQKPTVKIVHLVPDEAVLQNCKTVDGIFSGPFGLGFCGYLATCSNVGS